MVVVVRREVIVVITSRIEESIIRMHLVDNGPIRSVPLMPLRRTFNSRLRLCRFPLCAVLPQALSLYSYVHRYTRPFRVGLS